MKFFVTFLVKRLSLQELVLHQPSSYFISSSLNSLSWLFSNHFHIYLCQLIYRLYSTFLWLTYSSIFSHLDIVLISSYFIVSFHPSIYFLFLIVPMIMLVFLGSFEFLYLFSCFLFILSLHFLHIIPLFISNCLKFFPTYWPVLCFFQTL